MVNFYFIFVYKTTKKGLNRVSFMYQLCRISLQICRNLLYFSQYI